MKMPNKVDAHHNLIMIPKAMGNKLAAMNRQYPNAVNLSKWYAQQSMQSNDDVLDWDEVDILVAPPQIKSPQLLEP